MEDWGFIILKKQCNEQGNEESEIRYREIDGKTVRYGFVGRSDGNENFGISIECDGIRKAYEIGNDFSCAARLYDMMTRGLVTHITAAYIIDDYFFDK